MTSRQPGINAQPATPTPPHSRPCHQPHPSTQSTPSSTYMYARTTSIMKDPRTWCWSTDTPAGRLSPQPTMEQPASPPPSGTPSPHSGYQILSLQTEAQSSQLTPQENSYPHGGSTIGSPRRTTPTQTAGPKWPSKLSNASSPATQGLEGHSSTRSTRLYYSIETAPAQTPACPQHDASLAGTYETCSPESPLASNLKPSW